MMDDFNLYQRQWDLLNTQDLQDVSVTVVGCGSVGSVATMTLLKMGLRNVQLFDDDRISQENLPNQFLPDMVGEPKVFGLESLLSKLGLYEYCNARFEKWTGQRLETPVVISAADDMEVRRALFAACVRTFGLVKLFIDVRSAGEYMKVYAVDPSREAGRKFYISTLHTNAQSEPADCMASQIIYSSLFAGGLAAQRVKQWVKDERVPQFTTYAVGLNKMFDDNVFWNRGKVA